MRTGGRMIEPNEFRRVMGHFPSGVAIVTTSRGDGGACGLTVNAFSSVSLTPPLLLVCIEKDAESHACIRMVGRFGVNVLDARHGESLSRRFAEPIFEEKFRGVAYRTGSTGVPILEQALAWIECQVAREIDAGDHTIFLGEVLDAGAVEGQPLVYYRGGYGRFES